jgi:hypothetical protein
MWERKDTSGQTPSPRHRHSAVAISDTQILVFGGSGMGNDNNLYVLDVSTMVWNIPAINHGEIPTSRWGHTCVKQKLGTFLTAVMESI